MKSLSFYKSIPYSIIGSRKDKTKTKFILVAHGRSGSTLFFDLLRNHPYYPKSLVPKQSEVLSREVFKPHTWLESLSRQHGNKLFGVHIKVFDHLEKTNGLMVNQQVSFFKSLEENGWKIIYLKRDNVLDIALSILIAKERMIWHHNTDEQVTQEKIKIKIPELIRCMQITDLRHKIELRSISHVQYFPISYEKSFLKEECHQNTMNDIFNYLNVQQCEVKTTLKRTSTSSPHDVVENFNEVQNFLSSTEYSKYLKE